VLTPFTDIFAMEKYFFLNSYSLLSNGGGKEAGEDRIRNLTTY
jgi:hypothetical protein